MVRWTLFRRELPLKEKKRALFFEELSAIFDGRKLDHILLINDARRFTGEGDYSKVDELAEFIKKKNGQYQVEVKHDIIRFVVQAHNGRLTTML